MGVAGFAAANIMLLSVSVWAGHGEMGEATRTALHALSGLIAFPVLLFSGRHFFTSAIRVLRRGHANMDVPISLALCLAFGVSVSETIRRRRARLFRCRSDASFLFADRPLPRSALEKASLFSRKRARNHAQQARKYHCL